MRFAPGAGVGGCRQAAQGRFAQLEGKAAAHLVHGLHRLVEAHQVADARKRGLGAHQRRRRARGVAFLARHLHQAGNRVAHQAHHVGERVARGVHALLGRAALKLHACCRGHRGCRPDLGLAAAFGAGDRGVAGDQIAHGGGAGKRALELIVGISLRLLKRQQHAGDDAG